MSKNSDKAPNYRMRQLVAGATLGAVAATGATAAVIGKVKHVEHGYHSVYHPGTDAVAVTVKPGQNATSIALEFAREGTSDEANIALSLAKQDPHMHDGDTVLIPNEFIEPGTPGATAREHLQSAPAEPVPAQNPHHQ